MESYSPVSQNPPRVVELQKEKKKIEFALFFGFIDWKEIKYLADMCHDYDNRSENRKTAIKKVRQWNHL